jgi:uncharacterized protein (TIGR03084 family)
MDDILHALTDQQAELSALLDGLDRAEWDSPSPCEGWTVADVVLHLAQTNEMAIGSVRHRLPEVLALLTAGLAPTAADVDAGAAAMVEAQRDVPPESIRRRWQDSTDELAALLTAADPHERVTWVAGELSIHTLATTRLAETWIHTGDVADAVHLALVPTDRLRHVARLAWRTLPYAFARAGRELNGPVAFDLVAPAGGAWIFEPEGVARTTIRGDGVELCRVAARRVEPSATGLVGVGPDAEAVLELVRTYA